MQQMSAHGRCRFFDPFLQNAVNDFYMLPRCSLMSVPQTFLAENPYPHILIKHLLERLKKIFIFTGRCNRLMQIIVASGK